MKPFSKENFYKNTFASFISVSTPEREPDYESESSRYWYTANGVYRESNHWTWVGSCFWTIDIPHENYNVICGFCNWASFAEIVIFVNDIFKNKLNKYLKKNYPYFDIIPLSERKSVILLGNNDETYYPSTNIIPTSIEDQYVFTWSFGVKN